MKRKLLTLILLAICVFALTACFEEEQPPKTEEPGASDSGENNDPDSSNKTEHKHTEVEIAEIPATCTESGLTAGKKCSECGEITVEQKIIEALGHTVEKIQYLAPTCGKDGHSEGDKCPGCGLILRDPAVIPATGYHKYGEWEVVSRRSCTAPGITQRKCEVCEDIDEEYAPPRGHVLSESSEKIPATCTESGWTMESYCHMCDYIKEKEEIPPLGHSFIDGECTVCFEPEPTE